MDDYETGALITGVIAFIALMVYAVSTYGWFLGLGMGWIPAGVIAFVIGLLWPVVLFALALVIALPAWFV